MSKHYFCQLVDYDAPEDWCAVSSFGPSSAAREYAKDCDARSGGELFAKPTSIQTVIVQDKASGERQQFEIEVEFVKDFHAKAIAAAPSPPSPTKE